MSVVSVTDIAAGLTDAWRPVDLAVAPAYTLVIEKPETEQRS